MKPYLATDLKMMNRQNVYRLLEQKNELSRAEISRITNISMPTVMKIVAHFLETGIVTEAGDGVTAMGRKPQMLRFEPSAYYSVGVEYEGDYLRAGMVDLRGGIALVLQERVMGRFREVMTHQLLSLVEKVIAQSGVERSRIAGVGMGVPAIVDVEKVTVSAAPAVGILEDIDCKPILAGLSERLELPMYLENDTNAAALGEYATGLHDAGTDLLYVSLGTGLGAGLIVPGQAVPRTAELRRRDWVHGVRPRLRNRSCAARLAGKPRQPADPLREISVLCAAGGGEGMRAGGGRDAARADRRGRRISGAGHCEYQLPARFGYGGAGRLYGAPAGRAADGRGEPISGAAEQLPPGMQAAAVYGAKHCRRGAAGDGAEAAGAVFRRMRGTSFFARLVNKL